MASPAEFHPSLPLNVQMTNKSDDWQTDVVASSQQLEHMEHTNLMGGNGSYRRRRSSNQNKTTAIPQFSRTVLRPMFGPNRSLCGDGSSSNNHHPGRTSMSVAERSTLEPQDITPSTFKYRSAFIMKFSIPVVEAEFVVYYLSHRKAAFGYCLVASCFAIIGVLLYVTEYLNAFARSLMLISGVLWAACGVGMIVLFMRDPAPFSVPITAKKGSSKASPRHAADDAASYLFSAKSPARQIHRQNAQRHEYLAASALVVCYLFCIANFAGKGRCKNPLWDADDELRACRAAMQSDSVIIIFMAANTFFLRFRSFYFAVVSVALTALYIGMKLSPVMIDVVPEYFWGSFTVIVVELALSIVAVYLREREGRRQFETFVQRHLKAMELSEVHRQTERMIASQIPLAAIRAIQESGLEALPSSRTSGGLWAWSSYSIACSLSVNGFAMWSAHRGPSDTVMFLQRLLDVFDAERDAVLLLLKEFGKEVDTALILDKYHTFGDEYFVMSICKEGSDEAHSESPFCNDNHCSEGIPNKLVLQRTVEFALRCVRGTNQLLVELDAMLETSECPVSTAKMNHTHMTDDRHVVEGEVHGSSSDANGGSQGTREGRSSAGSTPTITAADSRAGFHKTVKLASGLMLPRRAQRLSLCAAVAHGVGGGLVFLETKNIVAVGEVVDAVRRQKISAATSAARVVPAVPYNDHYVHRIDGALYLSQSSAQELGGEFATSGSEYLIPLLSERELAAITSQRRQQGHSPILAVFPVCRCLVVSDHSAHTPTPAESQAATHKCVSPSPRCAATVRNPLDVSYSQGHDDEVMLASLQKDQCDLEGGGDPFDVLTRMHLFPWRFRDDAYETRYQQEFATTFSLVDTFWSAGSLLAAFFILFVCCAINNLWRASVGMPLVWIVAGVAISMVFGSFGIAFTTPDRTVVTLRIPLMVLHWCATACFVVSVFLAPSHTLMGDSQMVWLFVMFHVSMVRPRWSSYLVMWITDCILAVAFFVRTLVFFDVQGSVRLLSLVVEVAYSVYILCAWIALEYSHREAFTNDAHFGFLKARIEEDYRSLEATLVSLLPEGVGGGLVARARARSGWAREVVEVHPLWSTSFGTSTAETPFVVFQFQPATLKSSSVDPDTTTTMAVMATDRLGAHVKALLTHLRTVCSCARRSPFADLLQCLKVSGDVIVFVASIDGVKRSTTKKRPLDEKEPQRAGAIIDFVKRVGEEFTREAGPAPFRAVAGCGPLIGAVVGRGSVSFEYYGPSLTTALHLIELVEYGAAVATSRIVRMSSFDSSFGRADYPKTIVLRSRSSGKARMHIVIP